MSEMQRDEYLINIKVKNNLILTAIREFGYESLMAFCRDYQINYSRIVGIVNLRETPYTKKGDIKKGISRLCVVLNRTIGQLFTEKQVNMSDGLGASISVSEGNIEKYLLDNNIDTAYCLEDKIVQEDNNEHLHNKLFELLDGMRERERIVIEMRYGFNGEDEHTQDEVGKRLGISTERVRQIEKKVMRRMRHPFRSNQLEEFCNTKQHTFKFNNEEEL